MSTTRQNCCLLCIRQIAIIPIRTYLLTVQAAIRSWAPHVCTLNTVTTVYMRFIVTLMQVQPSILVIWKQATTAAVLGHMLSTERRKTIWLRLLLISGGEVKYIAFNTTFGQKGTVSNTFSVARRIDRILVTGAIGNYAAASSSYYSITIYGISESGGSTKLGSIDGTRGAYERCHKAWGILTVKNAYKSIKVEAYSNDNQDSNNSITIIACV